MVISRTTTAEEDAAIAAAAADWNRERVGIGEPARTPQAFIEYFLNQKIAACVNAYQQSRSDAAAALGDVYQKADAADRSVLDSLRQKYAAQGSR